MFTNSGLKHRTQHHEARKFGNQQQLQRPSNLKVCIFCSSNTHYAINCNVKTDYESRIAVVKNKRLCYNCLGTHQVTFCKSQKNCKNCNQRHHTSICKRANYDTNQRQQATSSIAPELQRNTASLHTYNDITFEQTTPAERTSGVLLKTAISTVTSGNYSMETNILFDEGSQRSYITQQQAEKLNITPTGTDTIYLASFGNSRNEVRHLDTATVNLISTSGQKIPINVLIVPTIAVPLQNYNRNVTNLPHLRGLKLKIQDTRYKKLYLKSVTYITVKH